MKIFNKNGLTFIELVISISISAVVMIIISYFISDSINILTLSNKKAETLWKYYNIYDIISEYKNNYNVWETIIDNTYWSWNDIALITNIDNTKWVLLWIIDKDTMKLESGSLFSTYWNKVLWYKELTLSELYNIKTSTWNVFSLSFDNASFFDAPIKNFQTDFFNSWSIFQFNMDLLLGYNLNYVWKLWKDIPSDNYYLYKINFIF